MKLNDVFKLNLQSKGGAKLFDKIMNRYGIPKDEGNTFKESVEVVSSGSNDSGKIDYYRIIYTDGNDPGTMAIGFATRVLYNTVLGQSEDIVCLEGNIHNVEIKKVKAIRVDHDIPCILPANKGYDRYVYEIYGNIYVRFQQIVKQLGNEITEEEIKDALSYYIEEITEEQYESMKDVKNTIVGL